MFARWLFCELLNFRFSVVVGWFEFEFVWVGCLVACVGIGCGVELGFASFLRGWYNIGNSGYCGNLGILSLPWVCVLVGML